MKWRLLSDKPYANLIERLADDHLRYNQKTLKHSAYFDDLQKLDREAQKDFVLTLVDWLTKKKWRNGLQFFEGNYYNLTQRQREHNQMLNKRRHAIRNILTQFLRRKLPFRHDEVVSLLEFSAQHKYGSDCFAPEMLRVLEHYLATQPLTPEIQAKIETILPILDLGWYGSKAKTRRWTQRFKELGNLLETDLPFILGEAWADYALIEISQQPPEIVDKWVNLLQHCTTATSSRPSKKWNTSAQSAVAVLGTETFKQAVLDWFPLVAKPRTQTLDHTNNWGPDPNLLIDDLNADILKGLVWMCGLDPDPEITRALTDLALSAYKKVPQRGPRCTKLGNACVMVLGTVPGLDGVGQLALLKVKVKTRNVQKGIDRALTAAAEREAITRADIEELAVPTYGLTAVGLRREELGDFFAELTVTGTRATKLGWIRPDGKLQKSVPKQVRDEFPAELKELRRAARDLKKMLPAQRDRIDNLYLRQKTWDYAAWRERYLDHPLVGTLARRLIWQFGEGEQASAGIWLEEKLVSHDNTPLEFEGNPPQVSLWHPINESTETVLAWREFLLRHQIQQPFKQAHREVYPLTDAECQTEVYSNRYAAHVIRQHQFHALCGVRGWHNQLRLMVDDFYGPPVKHLPEWGLRAEFWVEGIGRDYGTDTNDAGTYLYLTTDQVRFYREGASGNYNHAAGGGYRTGRFGRDDGDPVPLAEIPPLVLTEIMRDVDLFVGVASIGNDPNWLDGGRDVPHRDYWHSYSFGELSTSAQTRKELLGQLLPALKISGKCELTAKFLVVRGQIRTYKIHLGSGNILMEPNDQYLCIVPARGAAVKGQAGKVFLPFEGDQTLAVILSKAFLLADDKKITDQTITRQIKS